MQFCVCDSAGLHGEAKDNTRVEHEKAENLSGNTESVAENGDSALCGCSVLLTSSLFIDAKWMRFVVNQR